MTAAAAAVDAPEAAAAAAAAAFSSFFSFLFFTRPNARSSRRSPVQKFLVLRPRVMSFFFFFSIFLSHRPRFVTDGGVMAEREERGIIWEEKKIRKKN